MRQLLVDDPDPDRLRRLREFQASVRRSPRSPEGVVPARAPVSGRESEILARLRRLSPQLADSFEQALKDLNDHTRLSYIGPAGEIREVMRAAIQLLAPDEEVKGQAWYVGIEQGGKRHPSQAERARYAAQRRGGSGDQVRSTDSLVDELVGQVSRQTYASGSGAFHGAAARPKVRKLTGWVNAILDEVLPE